MTSLLGPYSEQLQPLLCHHAPKQRIRMHIVNMHIYKLPLQLRAISFEEHRLVLTVPPNSTIPVLWVWPLHKHLPSDVQQIQACHIVHWLTDFKALLCYCSISA